MTLAAITLKVADAPPDLYRYATPHHTRKVLGLGYQRRAQINRTKKKYKGFEYGMGKRISSNKIFCQQLPPFKISKL